MASARKKRSEVLKMKRFALTLDLKDDPQLIAEYEAHHQKVWPEIIESIARSGIIDMEIYRIGTRLVMTMNTIDDFSFEEKGKMDKADVKVQEWEALMWKYQQPLAKAMPGEKWMMMNKIFEF